MDIRAASGHTAPREAGAGSAPSVGQLLRRYRALAGLTQEQLAERSGYSADYISKLERDQRQPPASAIDRLALVLGLNLPKHDRLRAARTHAAGSAARGRARLAALPRASPLAIARSRPVRCPPQLTSFIGREHETATISTLLRSPDVHLLMLTGPGGIGKTRLALRVAELLAEVFVDGTYFVPLAGLRDPQHVAPAIASTLGVAEAAGVALPDAIVRYLGSKNVLLVLDNFEHVQAAAAFAGILVARCPALRLLVTSRAALQLSSEHRLEVAPLATPRADQAEDVAAIGRHAAVMLFVERAQALREDFRLDRATAPDVGAICSSLDGLPLAIELAAARVRVFPPHALLQRLSPRLALLSGGALDRPSRHQTLRATIDWSFELLTPRERLLFARLSTFAGGCTFQAIEQVCNPDGDLDIVELLTSLVDKSLIHQAGDQESRFWLLETIREYAADRLQECGERELIRHRHATYFASMLRDVEPMLVGSHQFEMLAKLDAEVDNVRAALACLLDQGRFEQELTMASALFWFWVARGHCSEDRRWLEHGLHAGGGLSQPCAPRHSWRSAKSPSSRVTWIVPARPSRKRCRIVQALGDQAAIGQALNRLGVIAWRQGAYERALASDETGLRIATAVGDPRERAYALVNLGIVATHRGDHAVARERLSEAVQLNRAIGDQNAVAHALINQSWIRLHAAGGMPERAARLDGVVRSLRTQLGVSMAPAEDEDREHARLLERAALGEHAYRRAQAEGSTLSLDEVLTYALAGTSAAEPLA